MVIAEIVLNLLSADGSRSELLKFGQDLNIALLIKMGEEIAGHAIGVK